MFARSLLVCTAGLFLMGLGLPAQAPPKPLTNGDVIEMSKGGLSESMIISAIQSQPTNFDISATGLLRLKADGVSPKIMEAILAESKKQKDAAAAQAAAKDAALSAVPAPSPLISTQGQPSVWIVQGPQKQALPTTRTQIVQAKSKASTLSALAGDQGLAQAFSGISQGMATAAMMKGSTSKMASTMMMVNPMTAPMFSAASYFAAHRKQAVTYIWAVPGPKSETAIQNKQPEFEIHYDGIPGINSQEYEPVLLKLEPTPSNVRLVGATEAKQDSLQASTQDWGMYSSFVEERIPAQATTTSPGISKVQPNAALAPGEYSIALRPLDKNKKFAGSSVAQNTGDGLVFNSVWTFEIQ